MRDFLEWVVTYFVFLIVAYVLGAWFTWDIAWGLNEPFVARLVSGLLAIMCFGAAMSEDK